jgi:hypothetical protein
MNDFSDVDEPPFRLNPCGMDSEYPRAQHRPRSPT